MTPPEVANHSDPSLTENLCDVCQLNPKRVTRGVVNYCAACFLDEIERNHPHIKREEPTTPPTADRQAS